MVWVLEEGGVTVVILICLMKRVLSTVKVPDGNYCLSEILGKESHLKKHLASLMSSMIDSIQRKSQALSENS